jgi:GT2 family glycosyltransferase
VPPHAETGGGPQRAKVLICTIMTVRNRRACTVSAVRAVLAEATSEADVTVVLVDDGSTDGTARSVAAVAPDRVRVVAGSGELYWAAGMALAERVALGATPDYLLWLNDDVVLDSGLVSVLLDVSRRNDGAVAVGATRDPVSGTTSYSGLRRTGGHPLAFGLVEPAGVDQDVATFNGNVVLVPRAVYEAVGGIDGAFAHAYADIDYGLRVGELGHRSVLAGRTVGSCARNPSVGAWTDKALPSWRRVRLLHGRKGAPPRSGARFLRRHGGPAWPVFLATPYLRIAGEGMVRTLRRGHS